MPCVAAARPGAIALCLPLQQQAAQGAQFVELLALLIDHSIELLHGIFQTDEFQLYINETLFHCGFTRHLIKVLV